MRRWFLVFFFFFSVGGGGRTESQIVKDLAWNGNKSDDAMVVDILMFM